MINDFCFDILLFMKMFIILVFSEMILLNKNKIIVNLLLNPYMICNFIFNNRYEKLKYLFIAKLVFKSDINWGVKPFYKTESKTECLFYS
jgi:hypothetical protein